MKSVGPNLWTRASEQRFCLLLPLWRRGWGSHCLFCCSAETGAKTWPVMMARTGGGLPPLFKGLGI